MQENDPIQCSHCREASFAKRKALYEGFRKTGEILVCALCGAPLETSACVRNAAPLPSPRPNSLAALLGEKVETIDVSILGDGRDKRFCRDCAEYIKHPFRSRCQKLDREVDPMGDCPMWRAPEAVAESNERKSPDEK